MIAAVGSWLLTYAVHSTIVLGFALILLRLVRRDAARELLVKVALPGALLTSTIQLLSPIDPFGGRLSWQPPPAAVGEVVDVRVVVRRTPGQPPIFERHITTPAMRRSFISYGPSVIVATWLLSAALALGLLSVRRRRLTRLLASRRRVHDRRILDALLPDGSRVRVSVSEALSSPITIGACEICLPPRALTDMTTNQLRAIGAHELAHLVARDARWLGFCALVEAVLPFQPLHRIARLALNEQMELRCDAIAAARTRDPESLALSLADVATWISTQPNPPGAPAMVERDGSLLVRRVERLLRVIPPDTRTAPRWLLPLALATLAALSAIVPTVLVGGRSPGGAPVLLEKEVELIR